MGGAASPASSDAFSSTPATASLAEEAAELTDVLRSLRPVVRDAARGAADRERAAAAPSDSAPSDAAPSEPGVTASRTAYRAETRTHPADLREHPADLREHPAGLREHPAGLREHPAAPGRARTTPPRPGPADPGAPSNDGHDEDARGGVPPQGHGSGCPSCGCPTPGLCRGCPLCRAAGALGGRIAALEQLADVAALISEALRAYAHRQGARHGYADRASGPADRAAPEPTGPAPADHRSSDHGSSDHGSSDHGSSDHAPAGDEPTTAPAPGPDLAAPPDLDAPPDPTDGIRATTGPHDEGFADELAPRRRTADPTAQPRSRSSQESK